MDLYMIGEPNQTKGYIVSSKVPNIAARTTWAHCEPSEGSYVWDAIDGALQAARSQGGLIDLHILAGGFCPPWLLKQVATVSNGTYTVPVPWDATFVSKLTAFIQSVSGQYSGNIKISHVHVCPLAGVSGEFKLDVGTLAQWQAQGYSVSTIENCFMKWTDIIHSNFSQPQVISWMPDGPVKQFDLADSSQINSDLMTWCSGQPNMMNMNSGANATWLMSFAPPLPFGYQAVSTLGSLANTMINNAKNAGASFLEIYSSDVPASL